MPGEHGLALLYLDLGGIKLVNGHARPRGRDKLLAAVAARLRENCRECDTTARIGGDEFAIIQPLGSQPSAATALVRRLLHAIRQLFDIDGWPSMVGVSIGIAVYPAGGETPEVPLRNADTALYQAKESGRNAHRVFEPSMDVHRQERALVERDLCDAASLRIGGFESLLRWNHPVRGQLLPADFVSLAEANGLILPLGRWAMDVRLGCALIQGFLTGRP